MRIGPATTADIRAMMDLEAQCDTAAHWSAEQYRQVFQAHQEGPRQLALAVFEDTEAGSAKASAFLGFLVARNLAAEWELENIVVSPAARRRGLGAALLEELLIRTRASGSESVFLEVRESNQSARSLYEKVGFQTAGRRKGYYFKPQEDAILYRYDLL